MPVDVRVTCLLNSSLSYLSDALEICDRGELANTDLHLAVMRAFLRAQESLQMAREAEERKTSAKLIEFPEVGHHVE